MVLQASRPGVAQLLSAAYATAVASAAASDAHAPAFADPSGLALQPGNSGVAPLGGQTAAAAAVATAAAGHPEPAPAADGGSVSRLGFVPIDAAKVGLPSGTALVVTWQPRLVAMLLFLPPTAACKQVGLGLQLGFVPVDAAAPGLPGGAALVLEPWLSHVTH